MERNEFINKISEIAVKECRKRGYGDIQAWTCVCQAICESNYGRSNLMANANAFFGIKATSSWVKKGKYGGRVYSAKTKECYDGHNYTQITACFRAYYSMEDSVADYFDLMECSRYKASLSAGTVRECITAIKNGGYATSPTYIETICKIFETNKFAIASHTVGGTK